MSRKLMVGAALAAVLFGIAGGYRLGAGTWRIAQVAESLAATSAHDKASGRKVLFWKDPDGKPDYSATPKKTGDGREYLPVYDEEEPTLAGRATKKPEGKGNGNRKILYYRNPMGLADTSPVPKKDWMGMDYIPVYEGEEQDAGTLKVSLDRVQRAGVRTEPAALRVLVRPVKAPGIAKPDERTLRIVSLRADGFIDKLFVNETGQHIRAGEPLFVVYSPQIVSVQVDYRSAKGSGDSERRQMGALQRLRNFGLPESVIEEIKSSPQPLMQITWPAPVSGVVMMKDVVEGQMAKAGQELYRLADLSSIWVIAEVPEQDIGLVKIGAPARLSFRAYPGETFEGKVTFILHELDAATRTAKVRIELQNPEHRIKHEMFVDVTIDAGSKEPPRLSVPVSAVIDSGNKQVVLIDKGDGHFEPRAVKLGMRGEDFVEIRHGVSPGENVVVSANFLIDAESNLKAALAGFTAEPKQAPDAKP
jgi:membrane fusion protein, copper/silver efflux system